MTRRRQPEPTYSIGEVAEMFDLTARTLRFYEEMALIKPRRQGSRRIYGRGDCARLKLILRGRRLNFSFDEIREVLDLYRSIGKGRVLQIQRLREILREKRRMLDEQEETIRFMRAEIANVEQLCRQALKKKNAKK